MYISLRIRDDYRQREKEHNHVYIRKEISRREYILHVLERDKIRYSINDDGDFDLPDDIDLTELAEDVMCEEQRQTH